MVGYMIDCIVLFIIHYKAFYKHIVNEIMPTISIQWFFLRFANNTIHITLWNSMSRDTYTLSGLCCVLLWCSTGQFDSYISELLHEDWDNHLIALVNETTLKNMVKCATWIHLWSILLKQSTTKQNNVIMLLLIHKRQCLTWKINRNIKLIATVIRNLHTNRALLWLGST